MIIEAIKIANDTLQALSIPVTAFIGYKGLIAWKEQMRGKDEYDTAKGILKIVYKIRERLKIIRSPLFTSGEMYSAAEKHYPELKDKGILIWSSEEKRKIDSAIFFERWKHIFEILPDFELYMIEAEVQFGWDLKWKMNEFEKIIQKLKIKTDSFPRMESNPESKTREEFSTYIFGHDMEKGDEFQISLNGKIEEIEGILKPHIRHIGKPKFRIFGFKNQETNKNGASAV